MKGIVLHRIVFAVFVLLGWGARAQTPVADYSIPAAACLNQRIELGNNSTNADRFEWDFCLDDMKTLSSSANVLPITGMSGGFGYKLVEDKGQWFAFATSENNSKLFRLEFGSSPLNFPTVVSLGTLGGMLNLPEGIDIVNVNGLWYGFVGSLDFSTPTQGILRLDFGSSLSNTPVVQNLGNFGLNTRFRNLKVILQGTDYLLVLVNYNSNSLLIINYHNSFSNVPAVGDILDTGPIPGAGLPAGIDFAKRGTAWIALLTSLNTDQVLQLNFGANLFSIPSVEGLYSFPGLARPYQVKLIREGMNYFASVSCESNAVNIIDFQDLNPAHPPALVTHTGLPILMGLECVRWQGTDVLQGIGSSTDQLSRAVFQANCGASFDFSNVQLPQGLVFTTAGTKLTELNVYNSVSGGSDTQSKTIVISSNAAPDISILTDGTICVNTPVSFQSSSSAGGITTFAWNFGDATSSSGANVSHPYASAGLFAVDLVVTSSNGCQNQAHKTVSIYDSPQADFSLPGISPICTNQNYLLTNASSFDPASNPTWEWRLNGLLVSAQKDFTAQFSSPVSQDIRLKATIPGCSNEMIKTIATVKTGPVVDFSVNDNCQGTAVLFTNGTTGADAGYLWSFGDGSTSAATSPSHPYASASTFQATLVASNVQGCQNFLTKPVRIYSLPVPDFSVGLPPFSCANSLTPFQNTTPPLTDSNITNWSWQFNDTAGGTSTLQNPSYTFTTSANFNVSLTTTSDKGCSASTTRGVTISASPSADFMAGPSCLNQPTAFTDLSSGAVSRQWQIGASTFSTANPYYTFVTPGNFPVTLSVTGPNACSSVKMKNIIVPVLPVLDYSVSNPCAGQNATFTDVTSSPQDATVGWIWNFDGDAVTGNPAEYNFSPSGVFNVKMTTTHASGCRYTLSRNVLINPSPIAGFTASPDRGASPLIVQFASTPQPGASYSWKFLDKAVSTSTLASPVHTFLGLGDYSAELTVTNGLGCSDVRSMPILVLIPSIDLIMKDYSLVSDPVTGKLKSSVTILNNSSIPVNAAEIALYLSEKAVVNETVSLNLDPGQSAVRTLSFTLSPDQFEFTFLCAEVLSEKDVQADNNKRCINLASEDYFINPYPNPASGQVHIDWIAPRAGDPALIIIYDSMGKKSYEWQTVSEAGLNQTIHDLTYLAAGMYYVTIETVGLRKTTRFLRQ